MLNFQCRKRNLVCTTETAMFSFTGITKSELMCTQRFSRVLAQAST